MLTKFDVIDVISAIVALAIASFGLVDLTKIFWGGISNAGFGRVRSQIRPLFGEDATVRDTSTPLAPGGLLRIFRANWLNGIPLDEQIVIAKDLLVLRLDPSNSAVYAATTGTNSNILRNVAKKLEDGDELTPREMTEFKRFSQILTASVRAGYQRGDQIYRYSTRILAGVFSVAISAVAGLAIHNASGAISAYWGSLSMWVSVIIGLLATPLASVARTIASRSAEILAGIRR
jgi:hypothetical protein